MFARRRFARLELGRQRRGGARLSLSQHDPAAARQHHRVNAELGMTVAGIDRLAFLDGAVGAAADGAPGQVGLVILAPAKNAERPLRPGPEHQALGIEQVGRGGFLRPHAAKLRPFGPAPGVGVKQRQGIKLLGGHRSRPPAGRRERFWCVRVVP